MENKVHTRKYISYGFNCVEEYKIVNSLILGLDGKSLKKEETIKVGIELPSPTKYGILTKIEDGKSRS